MLFLSICLTILISSVISVDKIYKVPFKQIAQHKGIITVCLGVPEVCYPFKVSLDSTISFVTNGQYYKEGYQCKSSKTCKTIQKDVSMTYNTQKLIGSYINDYIRIEDTQIGLYNLVFMVVDDGFTDQDYYGVIGLGNINKLENSSFLKEAAAFNQISTHAMKLSQRKGRKGFIQFGLAASEVDEYLNPILVDKKIKTCALVDKKNPLLNCELGAVIYYNDKSAEQPIVIPGKLSVYFNNELKGIICPYYYFRLLTENIFKSYIEKGVCSVVMKETQTIECDGVLKEEIKSEFLFIIGKWSIKVPLMDLFVDNYAGSSFRMVNTDPDKNYWVFGNAVFNQYDFLADHDNNLINLK